MPNPRRHLFVTGFARSGTSMLAHLLDAQPHITVRGEALSAPLGIAAETGSFAQTLSTSQRNRALAWHKQSLETQQAQTRITPEDFATPAELYRLALDEIARDDDVVAGHKLTGYGPHTDVFDTLLRDTDTRCVCVLRDVRDVVLSQAGWLQGRVIDPDSWVRFARRLRALEDHPRVAVVRYEALVQDPDRALEPVRRLLDVPIRVDADWRDRHDRAWRDNSSFHDVSRPLDSRPVERWREAREDPVVRFAAWWSAQELAQWRYPPFDDRFSLSERVRFARARAVRTATRNARPLVAAVRRLRTP